MLRVWSACATQRDRGRIGERDGGGKWLLLCSQTVSKLTLAALSRDGAWQTLKIYSCFPKSSSCSFREKNFFSLACVRRLWSLSLCVKLCMNFLCFFKGFWELRAKAKFFFRFSSENLWLLTFKVVALHVFGEKFRRRWGVIMASVVCHVAVWVSDPQTTPARQRTRLSLVYVVCRMVRKAVESSVTLLFATLHFFSRTHILL